MATAFALPQTADSTSTSTALPVDFRNVSRTFTTKNEQRTVLADVNLHIDAGQVVAILGASGCGKSTLLRSVSGLDHPSSGAVFTGVREVNDINELCAVIASLAFGAREHLARTGFGNQQAGRQRTH